jgi:quercetin dioxygenase-like cupin family protein
MQRRSIVVLALGFILLAPLVEAQPALDIKSLVEKKVAALPPGPLFWRIESFQTAAQAEAAAGPMGLVAEAAGKGWLFTLGPAGRASADGTKVAEIGPLPEVVASQYLLRINETRGPSGSTTPVHTHPGTEAFYVLSGEISQKTPNGMTSVAAGRSAAGHGANTPMQVSSSGSADLHSLVMFVLDANKPFSSPAKFE